MDASPKQPTEKHESLFQLGLIPGKLHSFAPFSIFLPGYDSFNTGWNRLPLLAARARHERLSSLPLLQGLEGLGCRFEETTIVLWLVVWIIFIFPYIGNFIIPTDFHIFLRGRYTTNQFYDVLCVTPSLETLSMAIYDSTGYISTYLNLGCNRIY